MTHDSSDIGTIVHLPECPLASDCKHDYYDEPPIQCANCGEECFCDQLRACEQRIKQSITGLSWYSKARWTGYYEGIDAAREAVAKEAEHGPLYFVRNSGDAQRGWDAMSRHALAAIDALREKP